MVKEDDMTYNQAHYEAMGEVRERIIIIIIYIYTTSIENVCTGNCGLLVF